MTRARDRLVICGHTHGIAGKVDEGSWHDRLFRAAQRDGWRSCKTPLEAQAEENGWIAAPGLRLGPDPEALGAAAQTRISSTLPPEWVGPAREETDGERMLAPSRLLEDDAGGLEPPSLSPLAEGGPDRFRRGSLIHKLLQTLPDLPAGRRAASARSFLATQLDLTDVQRAEIASETLRVLDDPTFAALFGEGSRAEVALSGRAPGLPKGVVINGQIDRLVITDHEVMIVDYKTNRPPPLRVEEVASSYLAQMAAYRALLQALEPNKPVRCALLWTDGPRLMELPGDYLDTVLNAATRRRRT